ncbi:hypothetical protein BpHYR1_011026 [Brachionus plicatilis]|uniref:Uncharacterized protein n=1 Tax=Brachionus plicatilis TaxID=10195 RepID=A0A3M7QAX9_BRAPC|nr:hypothetical protein BpHYR1_011026 [Brachionus plicatilis]
MPIINFLAHNSSDQFAGLSNSVYCSINSKIHLTSNIWTSTGLVNSAGGTIKDKIVSEDYKPEFQALQKLCNLLHSFIKDFLMVCILQKIAETIFAQLEKKL